MMQPVTGAMFVGGWEMLLILLLLLGLGFLIALAVGAILLATRSPQPKPPPAIGPAGPGQPRDLEQELRTLARLKEQGLITEEDFNLKKKSLLGI